MNVPFVDIHTHISSGNDQIIAVQSLFLQEVNSLVASPFTAGIHPWHATKANPEKVRGMLENLEVQPQLVAIGETGLDKPCGLDYTTQKKIFELHIEFAEKNHKPLIIHSVKSWDDMVGYLKKVKVPFVLHGYTAGVELTKHIISLHGNFSLGKSILSATPDKRMAIREIPIGSLFMETDGATVTIEEIYSEVAKNRDIPLDDLKSQIYKNFRFLFFNENIAV